MGYGTSLGTAHEDELSSVLEPYTTKELSDRREINANETSGDFQSRYGAIDVRPVNASTMPLEASRKLTDAFKRSGGTQVPENAPETNLPDINDVQPSFAEDVFGKGEHDIRPALDKFYEHVKETFKLPGDMYSGKIPMGSVQEIERATDLASFMIGGPAPVAAKMADGSLGSFMGVKAKTFDKNALAEAQIMNKQGIHPNEIWHKTGTTVGAEGKWRQEIPDRNAHYEPQTEVMARLGNVLDHPELYKAYPELQNIGVLRSESFPPRSAEWDNPFGGTTGKAGTGVIRMGTEAIKDKGTLLHEIQHAIQDIEGWAKGGAPGQAGKDFQLRYERHVEMLRPEWTRLVEKPTPHTALEAGRFNYLQQVMDTYSKYVWAGNRQAATNYLRLAGEAEARNVSTRMELPDNRLWHPTETMDIPPSQQIVVSEPVTTSAYGVRDPVTGAITKSTDVQLKAGGGLEYNVLGDLYNKLTGKTSVTEISGDKDTHYPTQEDAKNAIAQGFGYGTGKEPYIDAKVARIKTEGLLADLRGMIESKSKNVDLTKLTNIGDRAKLATLFAQGALAANRSAIATLGFKPENIEMSTDLGPTTIAGVTEPKSGMMWVNAGAYKEGKPPSTVVHESIHNGLAILRKESPEAKEILNKLPNEEYVVRYMMAKKMGNPEEGVGSSADEQIKTAMALFKIEPKYAGYVEKLEELAAEVHKNQRPRGPR